MSVKFIILLIAGLVATTTAAMSDEANLYSIASMEKVFPSASVKMTFGATSTLVLDHNVGGNTILSIPVTVKQDTMNIGMELTLIVGAKTAACKLVAKAPTARLKLKMILPSSFLSAIDTLSNIIGSSIIPSATILTDEYEFDLPTKKGDIDVSIRSKAFGPLKYALQMTGSDINIKIVKNDIGVFQAGMAVPVVATVTLLDPTQMAIPVLAGACGNGISKVCSREIKLTTGSGLKTRPNAMGKGCQAFCSIVKSILGNDAVFSKALDLPKIASDLAIAKNLPITASKFVSCGTDSKCFSLGNTTETCKIVAIVLTPEELIAKQAKQDLQCKNAKAEYAIKIAEHCPTKQAHDMNNTRNQDINNTNFVTNLNETVYQEILVQEIIRLRKTFAALQMKYDSDIKAVQLENTEIGSGSSGSGSGIELKKDASSSDKEIVVEEKEKKEEAREETEETKEEKEETKEEKEKKKKFLKLYMFFGSVDMFFGNMVALLLFSVLLVLCCMRTFSRTVNRKHPKQKEKKSIELTTIVQVENPLNRLTPLDHHLM